MHLDLQFLTKHMNVCYICSTSTTTTNLCHTKVLRHVHATETNHRKDILNRACSEPILTIFK